MKRLIVINRIVLSVCFVVTGLYFFCTQSYRKDVQPSFEYISDNLILFHDVCNVYAIKQGNRALLIDFGSGKILNYLDDLGIKSIDWVLHTHNHRDQCQGDYKLYNGNTKIAIPAKEADSMTDVENFWKQPDLLYDLYVFKPDFFTPWYNIKTDRLLRGGETFSWNGLNIDVLDSPGHTLGSLSYIVEINGKKYAFTGDLIHSPGKVWSFHSLERNYNDCGKIGIDESIESLETVLSNNPDDLLPSHGIVIKQPRAAVNALVENFDETLSLLDILTGSPRPPPPPEGLVPPQHILPHLWWRSTSYYLISDDGKALFYDFAGVREKKHDIEYLKKHAGLKTIDVVIVSHYHDDHVADINYLKEKYGTQVWCHECIVDILENPRSYNIPCLVDYPIKVDRVLKENETFTWEGYTFEVFHYPGQTEYHQGMFGEIDGTKVIFSGDNSYGTGKIPLNGISMSRNYCRIGDDVGYMLCVKITTEKRPDLLLSGHLGAIEVTDQKIQDYLEWAKKIEPTLTKLIAEPDPNIGRDPNWVHMYPYNIAIQPGETFNVEVRVRNHLTKNSVAFIEIHAPEEWKISPEYKTIDISAKHTSGADFTVTVPNNADSEGCTVITANVVVNGKDWGEVGEMVIDHGYER